MPKRRRRGSGWSSASNKSPRKSNLSAVGLGEECGEDEENDKEVEKLVFTFMEDEDEDEWSLSPLDELVCLSAREEHEEENQKPKNKDRSHSHTLVANSSPVKRASPLSPTLLDNVLQKTPQPPGVSVVESETDVGTLRTPKIEEKQTVLISSCRSKRRRLCSELQVQSSNKASEKDSKTQIEDEKRKESTSHKEVPSESSDKVPLPVANFRILEDYEIDEAPACLDDYRKQNVKSKHTLCRDVIYELDEVDVSWLEIFNTIRAELLDGFDLGDVKPEEMELLLDRFEKENYYELQKSGMGKPGESDEDAVCCICLDGESDNSNLIIFCDMCNIPVHQDCFGVPFVPEGSWLCRRCKECPAVDIECIFCPNKDGAFKQTVDGRWSHVLCALWIPEVRFMNPSLVEPVADIDDIPPARWKLTCFLCKKKGVGACIQCHLRSCVTAFHATCAQAVGLSLKVETKESTGVRMRASCDKHTSPRDAEILKQKIETINRVLDEKRSAPTELQFPTIPADRISAVAELVSFPGKHGFIKRLYSYWRIKRKNRGGAPLLRDIESIWIQNEEVPPAPDKSEWEEYDPLILKACFEKMQTLKNGLTKIKSYCELVKQHCEAQREERNLKFEADSVHMDSFCNKGLDVYISVLDKLTAKDKHGTFAEPVTCDDAPGYFDVVSNPMDLSTMRKKVMSLEYSSLEEMEADFDLMINNCTTFNKKSTPYFKDALKLKEFSLLVFEDARVALEERFKAAADQDRKPDTSILKAIDNNINPIPEAKCNALQRVLFGIIQLLTQHDKTGVFAEPVDIDETPDYLTIIKKPMDFSTMRNKINTNQYSCIEELESDYFLMINNCLQYNDEKSRFHKLAIKMKVMGENVFYDAKQQHYIPGLSDAPNISKIVSENNNNYKTEECSSETPVLVELTTEILNSIMSEALQKIIVSDDEKIFMEPVTEEEAPGYFEVIKKPMDLSLIRKRLNSSVYLSLEDMEKDFSLMIENCKKFNTVGTKYYNYATKIRRAGNSAFHAARKRLKTFKNPEECIKNCDQ